MEAKRLRKMDFREIGVMIERIGAEHATREFFSTERKTYASIMDFHGRPIAIFLTRLVDGTLIFTGASDREEEEIGKLVCRGLDADLEERLEDHAGEVERRCAEAGTAPAAAGTMDDPMELCREYYRYSTGAYRSS